MIGEPLATEIRDGLRNGFWNDFWDSFRDWDNLRTSLWDGFRAIRASLLRAILRDSTRSPHDR